MEKVLTYIIVFSVILYCIYVGIVHVNNTLLFLPEDITRKEYDDLCLLKSGHYIPYEFLSDDKQHKLTGGLYNAYRTPSWNDKIFFYSHGNGSWIGNIIETKLVKLLSKYGSVLIYDYRGYGCNDGYPSDIGLENDALGVWNYVTKKVNVANVIMVGHSLGTGVSCRLLANITKNNPDNLPEHLILNAPFTTIKDMAKHIVPSIAWLSMYEFDNINNAKLFDDKVKICIFHSRTDEIVPYYLAEKLSNKIKCKFIEIYGKHGDQIYSREAFEYIHKISKY